MTPARSFALLYAAQFAGFGAMVPFLPAILAEGGLDARQVGVVLAVGSLVRLVAGPGFGTLADRADPRRVLAACAVLAAATALGFGWAAGFALLLVVQVLNCAAAAPVMPLTDALALRVGGLDYGRVRAAGSVAFIVGSLGAGVLAEWGGPRAAAGLLALGLALAAFAAWRLPPGPARPRAASAGPLWEPLREAAFRRVAVLSAAVQGSHAVYYGFSTIHWSGAGLSPAEIGALWAIGVVAEVLLFLRGGALTARLGPRGLAALAAGAGALRWGLLPLSADFWVLLPLQALHGLTFGAMHLAAMRVLLSLPAAVAGRAQTLHAAGVGAATGGLILAAGWLYAALGPGAYWPMAGLCLLVLPLAWRLR